MVAGVLADAWSGRDLQAVFMELEDVEMQLPQGVLHYSYSPGYGLNEHSFVYMLDEYPRLGAGRSGGG